MSDPDRDLHASHSVGRTTPNRVVTYGILLFGFFLFVVFMWKPF